MERESVMLDNIATSRLWKQKFKTELQILQIIFLLKQSISLKKLVSNHLCKEDEIKEYLKMTLQEIENYAKKLTSESLQNLVFVNHYRIDCRMQFFTINALGVL